MEKRKFTIEIDEMGWHCSTNENSTAVGGNKEIDALFAHVGFSQNKLVHLGDYQLTNEMLGTKNKIFDEQCIFTHGKHSFEGTFVDALEYINKNKAFK